MHQSKFLAAMCIAFASLSGAMPVENGVKARAPAENNPDILFIYKDKRGEETISVENGVKARAPAENNPDILFIYKDKREE